MKKRIAAFALALIAAFVWIPTIVAFAEEETAPETAVTEIKITADTDTVEKGDTLQLKASENDVKWKTSNSNVAVVDSNGVVKGKDVGRATITAYKNVNGKEYKSTFEVKVIKKSTRTFNYLANHSVLSYRYSYVDDYYYVNQGSAWQGKYGYNKIYDLVAPYILLEYDYVRVHFTYEGKDWMVQLWKGQYGLLFYGCETGVYSKSHSDEEDKVYTTYMKVDGEDRPTMQTSLYRDGNLDGSYDYQFTTPYEKTWWSTGFKYGKLTRQEPASELRQSGKITFKNEEIANLFTAGLKECGFGESKSENTDIDTYYQDGSTVYYSWQNISQAENTMGIKVAGGTLVAMNIMAFFAAIFLIVGSLFGMGLLAFLIIL